LHDVNLFSIGICKIKIEVLSSGDEGFYLLGCEVL
jgi:hypothetical protein